MTTLCTTLVSAKYCQERNLPREKPQISGGNFRLEGIRDGLREGNAFALGNLRKEETYRFRHDLPERQVEMILQGGRPYSGAFRSSLAPLEDRRDRVTSRCSPPWPR